MKLPGEVFNCSVSHGTFLASSLVNRRLGQSLGRQPTITGPCMGGGAQRLDEKRALGDDA